jgi:hypothetical protein
MTYSPQLWADNSAAYPLSAARMNYIESGLANVAADVDALEAAHASPPISAGVVLSDTVARTNTNAWVDILSVTETFTGRKCLFFSEIKAQTYGSVLGEAQCRFVVDGVVVGTTMGVASTSGSPDWLSLSNVYHYSFMSAGSHTVAVQFRNFLAHASSTAAAYNRSLVVTEVGY